MHNPKSTTCHTTAHGSRRGGSHVNIETDATRVARGQSHCTFVGMSNSMTDAPPIPLTSHAMGKKSLRITSSARDECEMGTSSGTLYVTDNIVIALRSKVPLVATRACQASLFTVAAAATAAPSRGYLKVFGHKLFELARVLIVHVFPRCFITATAAGHTLS